MPKPRSSKAKALQFQVQPWQTRTAAKDAQGEQLEQAHDIQYTDLIKAQHGVASDSQGNLHNVSGRQPDSVSQHQTQDQATTAPQLPRALAASTPWVTKGRQAAAAVDAGQRKRQAVVDTAITDGKSHDNSHTFKLEQAQLGSVDGSTRAVSAEDPTSLQQAQSPANQADDEGLQEAEDDDGFDLGPSSSAKATSLEGQCHLALLPSGHMSGHVIESRTRRVFGVMARCVSLPPSVAPGCMEDEDTDVLKLRLLNFQTNDEVEAVVSRCGGDMATVRPAEMWQLRKHLNIQDTAQAEEVLEVQVTFSAEQLMEGVEADSYLRRYNPRLAGRDAVINSGHLHAKGLPPGFLDSLVTFTGN